MNGSVRSLRILGTRGVPAAHGGFETFAEHLAPYLVEHGWQVTVYCQEDGVGPVFEDTWRGVRRVRMPVSAGGSAGTIVFDWKSTIHAAREPGLVLTLGYNTAVFCALYWLKGLKNVINMDGVEWRRQKWGKVAKLWFWLNDWAGCWLGHHLVADHPEIKRHLATRISADKITMIPYGSDRVEVADAGLIAAYGLTPGSYAILIARAEPENSILEVVRAWSREPRGCKLVVLGKYEAGHAYQRAVKEAASAEVIFPGAIYEKPVVQALRFHARFYVHGHQVGGTNPSLVESLGAGNAVLAHDNAYNRWVAGEGGVYFGNEDECAGWIGRLLDDGNGLSSLAHSSSGEGVFPLNDQIDSSPTCCGGGEGEISGEKGLVDSPPQPSPQVGREKGALPGGGLLARLRAASRARHAGEFTWDKVLGDYERLLGGV